MVLTRRSALVAVALVGAGCLKKKDVPEVVGTVPVEVALVFDRMGDRPPEDPSKALEKAVLGLTADRGLTPTVLHADTWATSFEARRTTPQRMRWLEKNDVPADIGVLVETTARYDNILVGRFRWLVDTKVTVWPTAQPEFAQEASFETPVFLLFSSEDDVEAVDAAVGPIAKKVQRLLDIVLTDPDAPWAVEGMLPEDDASSAPPPNATGTVVPAEAREPKAPETSGSPPREPGDVDDLEDDPGRFRFVYFVMVDRFANGDPTNDGDHVGPGPQQFHGGDLAGVRAHLDHLADLGVTDLWLSPLATMQRTPAGETGGFHGYWPLDPASLDPHLGTEQELAELRDAAADRGIGLVLDMVTNHVGYESTLPAEKPGWFHATGPIEDWDDPLQATTGQVHGLPDLDQRNPEVRFWMNGIADTWIQRAHPSGFRLDAVRHVGLPFWRQYNERLTERQGHGFLLIGELFDGLPQRVATTWSEGRFHQMLDFPLYYAAIDPLCGEGGDLRDVALILDADRAYPDPTQLVTFLDNHDLPRLRSRCTTDAAVADALAVQFAVRGIPSLTYGTETTLSGAGEPDNRGDMDFTRGPAYRAVQQMAQLRQTHPALGAPRARILSTGRDHLAALLARDGEVVLLGMSRDGPLQVELPKGFPPFTSLVDLRTGATMPVRRSGPGGSRWTVVTPGPGVWWLRPDPTNPDAMSAYAEGLEQDALQGAERREVTVRFEGVPAREGDTVALFSADQGWQSGAVLTRDGDAFVGRIALREHGVHAYKLVIEGPDGGFTWEDGPNRYLHAVPGTKAVTGTWGERGER